MEAGSNIEHATMVMTISREAEIVVSGIINPSLHCGLRDIVEGRDRSYVVVDMLVREARGERKMGTTEGMRQFVLPRARGL